MTPDQMSRNVEAFESVVKVAALGGTPVAPLTAWYSLAPRRPEGGIWYFGCDCPECNEFAPFFQDYSDGHLGNPFSGYGVEAVCVSCSARIRCPSEKLISAQWPMGDSNAPTRSEYANRVPRRYTYDPEYRPIGGLLHHYTSVDALLSILKTRSLWATNIRFLNDASESELGLSLMKRVAEDARATSTGLDSEILGFASEWLDRQERPSAAVYVLSLSTASNQLGQWRGYTRYGHGVCLSFNSGALVRRMQMQGWTFQNCRYRRDSQLAWADAILSRLRREAATVFCGSQSYTREAFRASLETCLSELLQVAATIKHDAFEQEQEVRFISPMIRLDDPRIRFRTGSTTRIPFIEFSLASSEETLPLQTVIVGPGPSQESVRTRLLGALAEQGLAHACNVTLSEIPYREL